jgi:chromosome partitioning protein
MRKVISVLNQKGGVGKTTSSINLSCCFAQRGYHVLLIDLDPQAHSSIGLGFEPDTYQYAIHDVLVNKLDIEQSILKTEIENLQLIPSHIRLDRAEQLLTPEMFKETRLHKAIKHLKYDLILIDCRPTLGTLTINALFASEFILVPCEMARFSLDGFSDFMDTIDHVRNNEDNPKEKVVRILLNKYDSRKKITNDWVHDQLEPFNDMLLKTKIRQNEALNQAHMAMEPVITFKPSSPGAQDYESLTEELSELWHL